MLAESTFNMGYTAYHVGRACRLLFFCYYFDQFCEKSIAFLESGCWIQLLVSARDICVLRRRIITFFVKLRHISKLSFQKLLLHQQNSNNSHNRKFRSIHSILLRVVSVRVRIPELHACSCFGYWDRICHIDGIHNISNIV